MLLILMRLGIQEPYVYNDQFIKVFNLCNEKETTANFKAEIKRRGSLHCSCTNIFNRNY